MKAHVEKEFKCECGKVFYNSQSFNGHKGHCKEHHLAKYGNLDAYNKQLVIQQKASNAAREAKRQQSIAFHAGQKQELETWLASKPLCEKCGKIITEKFGSGRFCSRACANSRQHSAETKQKIYTTLNKTLDNTIRSKTLCKICGKELKSYNRTGFCSYCLSNTEAGRQARKEAGRKGYETMLANGTHKGWQSRNITSYAENFWINVLDSNKIPYEREFSVSCKLTHYFLDFKLERNGKLVDLEIDGKQHTYEERAEADLVRDQNLQKLGYIIYRIPWNEINSEKGKQEMQQKIENFLNFYLAL